MTRSTNKSPTQIREEMEAKLEAAKIREAKSLAGTNEYVGQLQGLYDAVMNEKAAISRQQNGPQSFHNRRQGFALRLLEIEAGETLAGVQASNCETLQEFYQEGINSLAKTIADGGTLQQSDVDYILGDMPPVAHCEAYQKDFDDAVQARKDFTEERAKPKRKSVENTQTAES
tara:strand:+ start:3059 stop:3577 length:519 start_codon:yes stop_codon:yes gene_type:complete